MAQLGNDDTLLTIKEVAKMLKTSTEYVRQLEKKKLLMPINWGETLNKNRKRKRFIRYRLSDVLKFLGGDGDGNNKKEE